MSLIEEIDKTIQTLENQIPASPQSEKAGAIEKRLQNSLAEYFRDLDRAIDITEIERIYLRNVKP